MIAVYAALVESGRMKIEDANTSIRDKVIEKMKEDGYFPDEA